MKKDVAASAAGAVAPKKPEFSLIDEDLLKSRIYTIRGVKVMLDADLAEIYGYSTKDFNRQVKNNIEKFDEDFRFQLTSAEVENLSRCKICTLEPQNSLNFANSGQKDNLRCKNCTSSDGDKLEPQKILRSKKSASSWGGVRYAPYAFTEQGIYMLMTVLKGEQATAQSKALIRLFKQMKDYIAAENTPDIAEIATDVRTLSNKVERRANITPQAYQRFETPKGSPSVETLYKLAHALGKQLVVEFV